MRYSFIYNGYSDQKYYWEFIILIRKILLITAVVFPGADAINLQIYGCIMVIIISYGLHIRNSPYSGVQLNILERISLISVGTLALCGLYFQVISNRLMNILAIGLGIVGSFYFLVSFAKMFFVLQFKKLRNNRKVMKFLSYIEKKLCCCLNSPSVRRLRSKASTTLQRLTVRTRSIFNFGDVELQRAVSTRSDPNPSEVDLLRKRSLPSPDEAKKEVQSITDEGRLEVDESKQGPLNIGDSMIGGPAT